MNPEPHQGMDRRGLLQSLAALLGAAATTGLPSLSWAADAAPKFFSPAEYALLTETVDIMIPRTDTLGAVDAGVPAAMDGMMLSWASAERREEFRKVLADLDAAARAEGAGGFIALPRERRVAVLTAYDRKIFLNAPYGQFKKIVLTTYYLSEGGATQELRYKAVPGKWDGAVPVTPDTRAWAF